MIRKVIEIFLLLILFGCSSVESERKDFVISMPSGWDDSVIEKIKSGQSLKKTIAVLDFEGNEKITMKNNMKMADILITSLAKCKRFELVERSRIDKIIEEQKLSLTGLIDEKSALELGKISGAEYVVIGNITSATKKEIDKFGYILVKLEVGVDVRVVNGTTGKILLSESATGTYESKVVRTADGVIVSGELDYAAGFAMASKDAIEKIGNKISNLSPQIGFVVSIEKDDIFIDIGEDQGINAGDKLVIFRVGDEIIHPATKQHIGWKKEILAEIQIEKTEKSMSSGRIVNKKDKKEVQIGDYAISK